VLNENFIANPQKIDSFPTDYTVRVWGRLALHTPQTPCGVSHTVSSRYLLLVGNSTQATSFPWRAEHH